MAGRSAAKRAASSLPMLLLAGGLGGAFAQSDPLVSKFIPTVLADKDFVWAFAAGGAQFSRLDPFVDPVDIRNGTLPFNGPLRGGLGRSASLLLFFNYAASESLTVSGISTLDHDGKTLVDSLRFLRPNGHNNGINLGVEFSALALYHDTLILGGGRAGFAVVKAKPEGQNALPSDSLAFMALPAGEDSAVAAFRCKPDSVCPVTPLESVAKIGEPDSVAALAVDSAQDSTWLLIGTNTGLRRGLLGGNVFPKVQLPGLKADAAISILRIHADAANRILWVFSGSNYFYSDDHGRNFHVPPDLPGVATKASALTGFTAPPEAVNDGDSSFINFSLDRPGLVMFRRDSIVVNAGTGDQGDVVFDAENGLDITRGRGQLTTLALLKKNGGTALIAGTTGQGVFIRKTGAGQSGAWANINSLKSLKGGLAEVITFPTLFSGVGATGEPDYVNIGYRIKKDGKVTITIYNYAMEKVKVLVKGSPRKGGGGRSENPLEDRWDGRDESGRSVSLGTYYILVETDKGEKGWGKAIAVRGRN